MTQFTNPTLETIDAALFALLQSSFTFVTSSRRLKFYGDTPMEDQPALFLATGDMEPRMNPLGQPYRWRLMRKIWLYAYTQDDTTTPSSIMNPVVNAILNVLKPTTPGDRVTLGGLVYNVQIAGRIMTDEGLLGPQAVAVIPVELLTGEL